MHDPRDRQFGRNAPLMSRDWAMPELTEYALFHNLFQAPGETRKREGEGTKKREDSFSSTRPPLCVSPGAWNRLIISLFKALPQLYF